MLRKNLGRSATVVASGICLAAGLQGCGSGLNLASLGGSGNSAPGSQGVSAPSNLGYAWNASDKTLRPIIGIVGSSRVGASIVPAGMYAGGAASPVSSVGLLVRSTGQVDRILLTNASTSTLSGVAVAAGTRVRFSPQGTSAVLFTPGAASVTLVTNLSATTGTPQVASLAAASAVVDAAVSDGNSVAVLQKQGAGLQVALLNKSGAVQGLARIGSAGAIDFVAKHEDLLLVDAAANGLSVIRNATTAPVLNSVASGNLLKAPLSVSASQDGRWAVIANGSDSSIVRVDLTGVAAPQRIACPQQPTTVAPLGTNASFRFSEIGSAPAWLADMSSQSPVMFFIPALPS